MARKRILTNQQKLEKLNEIQGLLDSIERIRCELTEETLFYGSPMVAAIMNRVESLMAEVNMEPDEKFGRARVMMEMTSNLLREKYHELHRQERLARRKLDPDVKMEGTKCDVEGCNKRAVVFATANVTASARKVSLCKIHAREQGIDLKGKV